MQQNLRDVFERVFDDEPVPPPGDLAAQAMDRGRGIRRRRGLLAAGTAVVVAGAAMVVLNAALPRAEPPLKVSAAAAMMAQQEPACTWMVKTRATDVAIFLRVDVTDAQRDHLDAALRADPLVRDLLFETRQAAFEKFKVLWRDDPDFVASVTAESLPESFRLQLVRPSGYRTLAARYEGRAGVQVVVGGLCP